MENGEFRNRIRMGIREFEFGNSELGIRNFILELDMTQKKTHPNRHNTCTPILYSLHRLLFAFVASIAALGGGRARTRHGSDSAGGGLAGS